MGLWLKTNYGVLIDKCLIIHIFISSFKGLYLFFLWIWLFMAVNLLLFMFRHNLCIWSKKNGFAWTAMFWKNWSSRMLQKDVDEHIRALVTPRSWTQLCAIELKQVVHLESYMTINTLLYRSWCSTWPLRWITSLCKMSRLAPDKLQFQVT